MESRGFIEGNKRQVASILLVWMIVTTFLVVFVPLQTTTIKGQVVHLTSADAEDGIAPFDTDGSKNGVVVWNGAEDHIINFDYTVESWMTLDIPPLNYVNDPETACEINITGVWKIDVYGKLITNSNFGWTRTAFIGTGHNPFEGIYFHPGSEGRIYDSLIKHSTYGVVFMPGSKLMSPGVSYSDFDDNMISSLRLDGALGYTNVDITNFDARYIPSTTSLMVANGCLNISLTNFYSHGWRKPSLHISNADVVVNPGWFRGYNQPGACVFIEGNSNGTVLSHCIFITGNRTEDDNYYVRCDGSSILIDSCTFNTSKYGARSVIANDDASGIPAHLIVRQPSQNEAPGMWDNSFDNSTMNATGGSSITLQWYMNVYVIDPNLKPIDNTPIWVKDHIGNPAEPPSKTTDANGWANWTIVTELIKYNNSITNFNPFNVSALNNSIIGYADPEPTMDMSKEVTVIVPFNPIPNPPPIVSFINTPSDVQSGPVSIQFKLEDLDISDDGNLSITVEFWDPIAGVWKTATAHSTCDPTTYLSNNTLYTFVWDSKDINNFPDSYSTEVKIKIIPHDRGGSGTPRETGIFTVDNKAPEFLSGPVVTSTDTTALIEWMVDEPANASVRYGLDGALTYEMDGSTGSTSQTVTLTGLNPGRRYTFFINSVDLVGNRYSSYPKTYTFETEIHIHLYKGWNMISLAPIMKDFYLDSVLASIAGDYDAVQWYDAGDKVDPWKHNRTGKPFGNDLDQIYSEMGIWIHMKNDTVLIHDNIVPAPGATIPIQLVRGWNFVAYPSLTTRTVNSAMGPITFDIVWTYDTASDTWFSWDGGSGNLASMEMGKGYWIHVPSDQVWQVSYV